MEYQNLVYLKLAKQELSQELEKYSVLPLHLGVLYLCLNPAHELRFLDLTVSSKGVICPALQPARTLLWTGLNKLPFHIKSLSQASSKFREELRLSYTSPYPVGILVDHLFPLKHTPQGNYNHKYIFSKNYKLLGLVRGICRTYDRFGNIPPEYLIPYIYLFRNEEVYSPFQDASLSYYNQKNLIKVRHTKSNKSNSLDHKIVLEFLAGALHKDEYYSILRETKYPIPCEFKLTKVS